ncbi:Trigger factor [Candidatus Hydrogenisulfobacillus filiaventi]|uniref:Trigger factor n=1 Tax=Candidatus Hydrogenisulfobacillus filiaventi TaxID=2707344 RepID=A0A6F8ZIS7_9FIRM|nr:trigger factor [Bacillota bacterium]CAB1129698.1 Trigger factor [Candidatus Hydrogenisulfobacillus filiaventi]
MQVQVERLPHSVARLAVVIEADELAEAMDRAFHKVNSQYNIPGFRRGKAPRFIFERFVGREVLLTRAADDLVEERYGSILAEAGVEPVAQPRLTVEQLEDGQPFRFTLEVEVKPQVELGDYRSVLDAHPLTVEPVGEEAVEFELKRQAETQAQFVPADEDPVETGNRVVLAIRGTLAEVPEGQEAEPFVNHDEYVVHVGSGGLLEELERQLVGLKVGEPATLEVTYPEDYPNQELAGKRARFEVTVKENKRKDVPPVDDDLAATLGYDNLEAMREEARKRVEAANADKARRERVAAILADLRERIPLEVPEALVRSAIDHELQDLQERLGMLGLSIDAYLRNRNITLDQLRAEMRPEAERRVRDQLLLEAVARAEGISVSDQDVIASLTEVAAAYNTPVETLVESFKKLGRFEWVRDNMVLERAEAYLAGQVEQPAQAG